VLFEPISLAGLRLRNRIVRSATYEKMADPDGRVTDRLIDNYAGLARGGAGLIITGFALVHPSGRAAPQMLSLHADSFMEGLGRLTLAVHREGGVIAVQLVHGGRQCPPLMLGGARALSPSEMYDRFTRSTSKAMEEAEIWTVVDAFADAAWRARSAGFDALELHAAHGYLISSFLSPYTNRRDDYWGGDEERRSHFAEEVLKAVRQSVGSDYPVLIKINADDLVEGGLKPGESLRHVRRLEPLGLDAVEISGGMRDSRIKTIRPDILAPEDEAYFRGAGKLFKDGLGIPVILTGGMRSREVMEGVLERGEADLVGMSRPLIREPDLPNLMREGKGAADCISCNKCTRFNKLPFVFCKELHKNPPPEPSS
jgi:2,4-dienoyl-CoA reductase-like NADH-dependent reductase (Old Yellow Enzyme family)